MKVCEWLPNRKALDEENQRAIVIEQQTLERLGKHPRIVPFVHHPKPQVARELIVVIRYLGVHLSGIVLSEAPYGSLQSYIDSNHMKMSASQCWNLCEQVAEAIVHIHSKGVIHSDLRPENFLVHQLTPASASIWLGDFGGSMCVELQLDGGHLPDTPFFDPRMPWQSTPATDIFSLGSIFYAIMTGYWPFLNGPPDWHSTEDKFAYVDKVDALFRKGVFPTVSGLSGGEVIEGCWNGLYSTAEEVLQAIRLEMEVIDV